MAGRVYFRRPGRGAPDHLEHRLRQPADAGTENPFRLDHLDHFAPRLGNGFLALSQVDAIKNPRLCGGRNYCFSSLLPVQSVQREHGANF